MNGWCMCGRVCKSSKKALVIETQSSPPELDLHESSTFYPFLMGKACSRQLKDAHFHFAAALFPRVFWAA